MIDLLGKKIELYLQHFIMPINLHNDAGQCTVSLFLQTRLQSCITLNIIKTYM